jgi:hypothetical protein
MGYFRLSHVPAEAKLNDAAACGRIGARVGEPVTSSMTKRDGRTSKVVP